MQGNQIVAEISSIFSEFESGLSDTAKALGRTADGWTVLSRAASLPTDPTTVEQIEEALGRISINGETIGSITVTLRLKYESQLLSIVPVTAEDDTFYAVASHYPESATVMQRFVKNREPIWSDQLTTTLMFGVDANQQKCLRVLGFLPGKQPPLEPWLFKQSTPSELVDEAEEFWSKHARRVEDWPYQEGTERKFLH